MRYLLIEIEKSFTWPRCKSVKEISYQFLGRYGTFGWLSMSSIDWKHIIIFTCTFFNKLHFISLNFNLSFKKLLKYLTAPSSKTVGVSKFYQVYLWYVEMTPSSDFLVRSTTTFRQKKKVKKMHHQIQVLRRPVWFNVM